MKYMNDFDLNRARNRFGRGNTPNRLALALMVDNLRAWADMHSDGWAYWPAPVRAASKAIALIESRTWAENEAQERNDITDTEMRAAARPVKAFLTRAKATAEQREVVLRSIDSLT